MENKTSKFIFFVFSFLTALIFLGCSFYNNWQGVYYPNGCLTCEDSYIYSPIFENKEDCLNWAHNLQKKRDNPNDDFECGKNCKLKNGLQVCDETFR